MPIITTSDPTSSFPASSTSFNDLSVIYVVFSILSALFGAYVVLFVLAMWSTYKQLGLPYQNLRIVTVALFVDLVVHYTCRGITVAQTRNIAHPANEARMVTIPIVFIGAFTTTFAGFLSDGLLAWRFYVVYGRKRWALYVPAAAIVMNALLGLSGDFQHFTFYHSTWLYKAVFKLDVLKITLAWGWITFTINTILSGAIISSIIHVSRISSKHDVLQLRSYRSSRARTALAAIVESAIVTWIGLLLYLITALAPTGCITPVWNIGYVMACIQPIFFGISQCLITVRLGFSDDRSNRGSYLKKTAGLPLGVSTEKSLTILGPAVSFA